MLKKKYVLGMLIFIACMFLIFLSEKEVELEGEYLIKYFDKVVLQEVDYRKRYGGGQKIWPVTADEQGSLRGYNVSTLGKMIEKGRDGIYAAGFGLFPDEQCDYNLYRLEGEEWELFASHPPESVEDDTLMKLYHDETLVSNLISYNGFLYYSVMYDDAPGEGGVKREYIYRINEQGGKPEQLACSFGIFYIYNDRIYYRTLDETTVNKPAQDRYFYICEMGMDGENKRKIYRGRDNADLERGRTFALGGGCLYMVCGERIKSVIGINLKTGDRKYFYVGRDYISRFCYEDGFLYMCAGDIIEPRKDSIYRMDVMSGRKELVARNINDAWLENGFLYCITVEEEKERNICRLNIYDLGRNMSASVMLDEREDEILPIHLEVLGDELLVELNIFRQESYSYSYIGLGTRYYKCRANTAFINEIDLQKLTQEEADVRYR